MSKDAYAVQELPAPLRWTRVLLYVGAGLTVVTTLAALTVFGAGAGVVGRLLWSAWPGVAAFLIARRLPTGGRRLFWVTVVVCAFWILGALASLAIGDPRGLVQLVLPVAILVLLTRPPARAFLG